jgi:tetratricopeptide (TPR) repeat protein
MSADLKESTAPLAEISQAPNAFEAFLDRNQKGIVVLAILLALGGAAAVILRGIEKSRQETAGAALVKADDIAALQAVVSEHANTNAAGSAMVLLADRQWAASKQDEAIGTLQKFIADAPSHIAIPTAKASLGSKLMLQGKSGDAAKIFEELASDPSAKFIAPFALISLGDISKSAGDADKAEPFYAKVNTDFPDSSFAETASKRIATLRAKAPTEIAPPPVAPTPSPVENTNSNPNAGSPSAPKQ